ncbi:ribosome-associated translation inhibitor RaiA [Campylobacter sp. JMF_01 NE2]|uniref:ribosome hibernation-promoting factor, HPF/YfiA family n=1 Tax=unclassified Campylobacter TaxID=2593542 RepID=UPI0022E9E445|nr:MULTISPECIES: ribosome-associated translation inhibitor RaiA [unclassified Campylobacter]MDA3049525.1 ribosome-associated translation inhibitor RaiA [Campylobacter sp. JMF_15 NE4]MDA3051048.1 ribosome-associated translation inhibitor RaiA [Campylobacter sp. JMF_02 ED1]MDA3053048.1 ribosome-associated translation inhibitor RaiA [Campylobacter sp. JMF_03 NE3]MDA3054258.1 ribosome-associated translation inhibitor RaiA [Campylobacter sp. VBCF_07 NA4]MDA3060949.1 ribosome-associated translation 
MNLSIVGKQFELTDAIKDYITQAFDSLKKYNLDIISGRAVVSADEKQGRKGFVMDFSLNLAHQDTIVVREKDKDLYAAVDNATNRLAKVLRRYHDKVNSHKNRDDMKQSAVDEIIKASEPNLDDNVDEIVPTELDLYKPLEIDEALNKLKESTDQFLVFNDMDAKMRVLYKRKDGKFGLF